MNSLNGLKISICQMNVAPGCPAINAKYIIHEIEEAASRAIDIIVFPEMSLTGYLIGDRFEDDYFIKDVLSLNERVVESTKNGITAIFGTLTVSSGKGEDGRTRKHNSAIVARNGKILARNYKTLQPNYRFFNDDKHFYSNRKTAEEQTYLYRKSGGREGKICCFPTELLKPIFVETSIGTVCFGVILCEDMWHLDYALNPTQVLVEKGAKIIFNLSASPWTWQKNRKRHQVIKGLLSEYKVPFVYVNNTGVQNTGKNIIVFDGSSAIYNANGDIVFEVTPYVQGSHDVLLEDDMGPLNLRTQNDTKELYDAMACAAKSIVPSDAKVIVGLSGGIDSAVVAAHMVDVLGSDRVIAVNMPFRDMNSPQTKEMAHQIAKNLGIQYLIHPIDSIVDAIAGLDIRPDDFEYENIQAVARMTVLNKLAKKYRGRFTSNSNKVEIAFGYGTLYGDIAGFYAPLGDLVKREVRQIANYLNTEVFRREVIPPACINQIPTAELQKNQHDPFDYGDLARRGYHDEMVRAYTEFRKNPEWFLEMYINGKLEDELRLEKGTLAKLFPRDADFIQDLKVWWMKFQESYFKRIQSPPIPIFSKRAFGRDLEESLTFTDFTQRFYSFKKSILRSGSGSKMRIAVWGSKVNPPGIHHRKIVEKLASVFDKVIIVPCGSRIDQPHVALARSEHRQKMALMNFQDIENVEFDFYDLDNNVFTPTYLLSERYRQKYPDADIIFVIGSDLVVKGQYNKSEIQTKWQMGEYIWKNLKFSVTNNPLYLLDSQDLPPNSEVIDIENAFGRSSAIRKKIEKGESVSSLVLDEIEKYIREHKLFI